MFLTFAFSETAFSQQQPNMVVRGTINGFGNSAMTYRASLNQTWITTIQATSSAPNAGFLFANNESFFPKWSRGDAVTINAQTDWYHNTGDGTYNQVNGRFYTFIIRDVVNSTDTRGYLFETTAAPVSVSTVSQSPIAANVITSNTVTVTATTSSNLPSGQGVFLRYSTNSFSTSTVVNMTGSGTSYAATIPSVTNTTGANVVYYVFTSGGTTPMSSADADFATINLNNNNGVNYSYNVISMTPSISSVSAAPNNGFSTNAYNGSTITLNGTNLEGVTSVTLSSNPSNPITIPSNVSNTAISFVLPTGYSGTVTVTHPTYGNSASSATSITNLGFISTGSGGNWNVGASWLGGTVPSASTNLATIASGAPITLNTDIALTNLTINSGGIFTASDSTPRTITISNGGFITNNGSFTAGNGTVAFAGSATVSGTITFNNATLAGGVNFGTDSTIGGTLTVNPSGFVSTNAPTYNSSATLRYNTSGTYGRGTEWSATSGRGYPHHVQISGNTILNVHNNQNTQRQIAGDLTIDLGSTFTTGAMNVPDQPIGVIILGNIINNGTFTLDSSPDRVQCVNFTNNANAVTILSTNIGGDLELTGNFIDNAPFNSNNRAVFFTGSGVQEVSGSGDFDIDYIVSNKPSGSIRMLANLLVEGPNGGNAITLTNTSDILDLNGNTLTLGEAYVSSVFTGNGFIRGGSTSSISIQGTGALGTIRFDQSVSGTSNVLNNLTINRTSDGSVTIGNALNIIGTITVTAGTLQSGGNITLISNDNGTAQVAAIGSGSSITGNVTVERYIPAKRAWRLLTAPLKETSNTSIFSNWQGTNNEGILLWGPQGTATPTSSNSGMYQGPQANIWTHTGTAWSSVANTNTTQLFDANGNNAFLVFATGSHGSDYIASGQAATTTRARGDLITGNVSHSLTANQYKLIGNPYASPIDTEALVTSNSGSKIWLVDPTLGSFGGYVTHDGSIWSIPTPSGNDPYIQSGQGFFVRSASNITFTINESHKVTGNSNTWFERNANSLENSESTDRIRVLLYKQEDNQWKLADGILAVNSAGGNDEVDEVDSGKISNFNESLMFRNSNTNLSIEYRDLPSLERVQPMRLTSTTAQPYQLKVYTEHYSNSNLQPVIEDTQSGTFTPIPMNGEEIIIPFSGIVASATQPDMRFRIVYQSILSAEEFTEIATAVYPNPVQEGWFNVELKNMKPNTTYTLSNLLGQEVQSGFLEFQKNQIVINKELQGVYLLKITQDGKSATTKLIIK